MATKKNKIGNVPNLRFKEFEGEWKEKKLGMICEMQAGKFINASEISNSRENYSFPCYGGNGLRGYVNTYNHEGKYSLIGRQGALCGNVTLANGKFYATEHAVVVTTKIELDLDWLYYLLTQLNLNKYSSGMAQPGLSVQNLEKVVTKIPLQKKEQNKIASFLTLIDERIEAQIKIIEQLETLIKSFREKIFSQQLRFKDENGNNFSDWNFNTLENILIKNSTKNKNRKHSNVQSVSNKFGFINQDEMFEDRRVASIDTSNYYVIEKGLFAYNPSRIDVGSLAYKFDDAVSIISPLYISFKANNNFLTDQFLLNWFSTNEFIKQMNTSFEGSVRNTLSYENLCKMKIVLPSLKEQTVIANFLSFFDEKIQTEKKILEQLEQQKKYLLQNLFI